MMSRIASLRPMSQDRLRAWLLVSHTYHRQLVLPSARFSSALSQSTRLRLRQRQTTFAAFHSTTWLTSEAEEAQLQEQPDEPHATDIQYAFAPPAPLPEDSQNKVDELFDKIVWLDMIEVNLLTLLVQEQLGVKWSELDHSGGSAVPGAGPVAPAEEAKEERALRDVKLLGFDAKAKIKVIKEVRAVAGLGLKEAKELVESAPKVIQKDLKPEKAEELKALLEAVGAQVEIV